MSLALISHPAFRGYRLPALLPDQPRRIEAVEDQLIASGLDLVLRPFDAPLVDPALLRRVHDPAYLDDLAAREPSEGWARLDGDTWLAPGIMEAARRASGGAALGVDLVLDQNLEAAFCLGRPPGHHAHYARAAGFCLLNHIAVAARRAQDRGLTRIALVDFDAHGGDGTESLLGDEPTVRMYSLYQEGGFGTPAGPPAANIHRLPLPPRADGALLRESVEAALLPDLGSFRPELVLVSAGFDGHREDDLSDLWLREADYAWLVRRVRATAQAPLVLCLEGGYQPDALGRSVQAVLQALLQAD